jgi:amino acid transporter
MSTLRRRSSGSLGAGNEPSYSALPNEHNNNNNMNGITVDKSSSSSNYLLESAGSFQWRNMLNWNRMRQTKSVAIVMQEAAEDSGEAPSADGSGQPSDGVQQSQSLQKVLTIYDIIAYGVGSTVGAGIFVTTGTGALNAGPAIVLSFTLASLSCLFSAFAYSEFASRVPVSGSAYTFTYVCLGELASWFIGWNLTLEYAISAAAVARGWSNNFVYFFDLIGAPVPSALNSISVNGGSMIQEISILAAVICFICMGILLFGVKESSRFNMIMTIMNISVILFIIIAGSTYIDSKNWSIPIPADLDTSTYKIGSSCSKGGFFACGLNGILTGAAQVFFAYIGFDSVTTLAEEVKNPKRDLPIGIIVTLSISSALYIGASLVVTGMVPWYLLDQNRPLATAFKQVGNDWAATLIAGITVTGLTASTLTSLFGQPRIFYRMAKDGLLFRAFATLHPTTKAPLWGTIITGCSAAFIAFIFSLDALSNMISIGTLLAFSTVCGGIVILRYESPNRPRNSVPGEDLQGSSPNNNYSAENAALLEGPEYNEEVAIPAVKKLLQPLFRRAVCVSMDRILPSNSAVLLCIYLLPCVMVSVGLRESDTIPWAITIIFALLGVMIVLRIWYLPVDKANLPRSDQFICPLVPFLPCLGIFTNIYLITSLDFLSYVRVFIWTLIGFSIYFFYGIHHSRLSLSTLRQQLQQEHIQRQQEQQNTSNAQFSPSKGNDAEITQYNEGQSLVRPINGNH